MKLRKNIKSNLQQFFVNFVPFACHGEAQRSRMVKFFV